MYFSFAGVMSVSLEGAEKDELVVIGAGVDASSLTTTLMKKVGYAAIMSIGPIEAQLDPLLSPRNWPWPDVDDIEENDEEDDLSVWTKFTLGLIQ